MTHVLPIVALFAVLSGCAGDPSSADAGESDAAGWNLLADTSSDVPDALVLVLGSRNPPFQEWEPAAPVMVVHGPQGGVHTEHSAWIGPASPRELHLTVVWAEVWRDGLVLARAGWEFWAEQWIVDGDGARVELPPVIFDTEPELGVVELRGRAELTDGRTAEFTREITLVAEP